ncbi:MAG: hypothetical protein ACYDB9_09650 [Gammaproteobacteria bacterium]
MTFEEAFARLNGRAPTTAEVKDALAISDIVRQADLDPALLMFVADARAKEQRDRLPEDVRAAVAEGVAEIRAALPSMDGLVRRMKYVATLTGSLDAVGAALRTLTIDLSAVLVVVLVVLVVGAVADFRWAYGLGAQSEHQACAVLTRTKDLALQHEHTQTVGDISVALAALCRT